MLQTRLDTSSGQLPLDASSESPPVGLPAPTAESTTRSGVSLHIAPKLCAQCFRPCTHAALRRDFDGELYCRECWEEEYEPSEQPDPERSHSKAAASVAQNAALSCNLTGHAFSKRRSRQIRTGEVGAQQFVVEEIFDCEFCGCVHRRPWALSPTAR